MEKLKHYIVTRFNLGLYQTNPDADTWFKERIKIFSSVTLPSLRSQKWQNFTLSILIDDKTPKVHADMIWDCFMENAFGGFNIEITQIGMSPEWRPKRYGERWSCVIDYSDYLFLIRERSKRSIQTRLDNDDALMADAVEKIQMQCAGSASYCIDFTKGYAVDSINKKLYLAQHPLGTPFISIYQSNDRRLKCIYGFIHQKFAKTFPYSVNKDRIWVMNLHEHNVSNRLFPWLIEKEIPYDRAIPGCI